MSWCGSPYRSRYSMGPHRAPAPILTALENTARFRPRDGVRAASRTPRLTAELRSAFHLTIAMVTRRHSESRDIVISSWFTEAPPPVRTMRAWLGDENAQLARNRRPSLFELRLSFA